MNMNQENPKQTRNRIWQTISAIMAAAILACAAPAAAQPAITAIDPATITPGSPDTRVTVRGSGFQAGDSVVLSDNCPEIGSVEPPSLVTVSATITSASALSVTVPARLLTGVRANLLVYIRDRQARWSNCLLLEVRALPAPPEPSEPEPFPEFQENSIFVIADLKNLLGSKETVERFQRACDRADWCTRSHLPRLLQGMYDLNSGIDFFVAGELALSKASLETAFLELSPYAQPSPIPMRRSEAFEGVRQEMWTNQADPRQIVARFYAVLPEVLDRDLRVLLGDLYLERNEYRDAELAYAGLFQILFPPVQGVLTGTGYARADFERANVPATGRDSFPGRDTLTAQLQGAHPVVYKAFEDKAWPPQPVAIQPFAPLRAEARRWGSPADGALLKCLRIRLAGVYLAAGDQLFKRARRHPQQRELLRSASELYGAAIDIFAPEEREPVVRKVQERIDRAEGAEPLLVESARSGTALTKEQLQALAREAPESPPDISINPLVTSAISRASVQLYKLINGLNFLGYKEGYVPALRYAVLLQRAREYAEAAKDAENRYISFRQTAEELAFRREQLEQGIHVSDVQEEIAAREVHVRNELVTQAGLQVAALTEQIQSLERAQDWETVGLIAQGGPIIAGAIGGAVMGGPIGAVAGGAAAAFSTAPAFAGAMVSDIRSDGELYSLRIQRQAAQVGVGIAVKQVTIAQLQRVVAQMQLSFARQNLQLLKGREMNEDLFYELARTIGRINDQYLEMGVTMGFLAERSLSFETGQAYRFIKLDYASSRTAGLLAGDFLRLDLEGMEHERLLSAGRKKNMLKQVISLRETYPVQFFEFQRTGRLAFSTTRYQFDKVYPGLYQHRIRRVEVAVQGIIGPEGVKGRLVNLGTFAVRDRDATLNLPDTASLYPDRTENPYADRLRGWEPSPRGTGRGGVGPAGTGLALARPFLPELREALLESLAEVPVSGMRHYYLPAEVMVLSAFDLRQDAIVFGTAGETRHLFEDFGVEGLWLLELPKELNDLDYLSIHDVKLVLYYDAYYDAAVETKVRSAVRNFERRSGGKLDRIVALSLRQFFPDDFYGFGPDQPTVSFQLMKADFPLYTRNQRVKKVIVEILGRNGDAYRVLPAEAAVERLGDDASRLAWSARLRRDAATGILFTGETLNAQERTGFTELLGRWRVTLSGVDLEAVEDILVFLSYEYDEQEAGRAP